MALSKYFLNQVDLFILLIFEVIFFGLLFWAIEIGDTARSYAVIVAMIISACPLVVEKLLKITLPFGVKSIIALSLFLHIAGGVMRWYWSPVFPLFDKVAHFVSGLSVGLIILVFFLLLDMWGVRYRKTTILIAIFLLMAFFGGMWKVVEISNDVLNNTIYNDGLSDIIGDNVVIRSARLPQSLLPTCISYPSPLEKTSITLSGDRSALKRPGPIACRNGGYKGYIGMMCKNASRPSIIQ